MNRKQFLKQYYLLTEGMSPEEIQAAFAKLYRSLSKRQRKRVDRNVAKYREMENKDLWDRLIGDK